jgi:serine/threonine protein phosphatase 1
MSRWIIPDIHGCARTLKTLLENMLKVTKGDELFFLGDYIDRGPASKEVIDYLMDLQEKGWNIHCLKGNHEDYCVKAWEEDQKFHLFKPSVQKSWENVGAKETYASFGGKRPRDIPQKYIDWMRNLDYYFELEDYILVHAGMNFRIQNPFDDKQSMIWVRDFKVDFEKTNGRRIIHGHLPEDYSFIDFVIKNPKSHDFIALDNGVFNVNKTGMGNLMAFNPDTNELFAQSNMDM